MTLIELLVTLAILAIIGASLPAAMSVGIRTLSNGQTQGHLTASHDVLDLLQEMSKDVSRASCVAGDEPGLTPPVVGLATVPDAPQCTALAVANQQAPASPCNSNSILCTAWRQVAGDGQCHIAVYTQAGATVLRTEYVAGNSTPVASHNATLSGGGTTVAAASLLAEISGEEPGWGDFQVSVTATRVNQNNTDSTTVIMQPFSSDPSLTLGTPC